MRPRLIAVDDQALIGAAQDHVVASMRPRLIAVDDRVVEVHGHEIRLASMRPRLIAVDDYTLADDLAHYYLSLQ